MKVVLQTLGMGDLLNSEDIDIDKVLELAEVVQEYMIAAEDKNLGLKTLKKKQFKQLYKEVFTQQLALDDKEVSKLERQSYQDELERLSEMTLELVEEYMSQMDLDNEDLNDNPFMWGGGNLGPEETDKKTYDEWLNHFGVDDDEED